jgi:hypothetical protein
MDCHESTGQLRIIVSPSDRYISSCEGQDHGNVENSLLPGAGVVDDCLHHDHYLFPRDCGVHGGADAMSEHDDGGPAFPIAGSPFQDLGNGNYTLATDGSDGMTLRDYFAAQALIGMGTWSPVSSAVGGTESWRSARAKFAYDQADSMLEARKR